ncbi:MAG: hypothetical protein AMJ79_12940 [Phycisphaerae bacterium SM23_30]|nr:MAG: hypothetical protein AMJ79_12940 [Phycisphaerae bacterium SM23_30]
MSGINNNLSVRGIKYHPSAALAAVFPGGPRARAAEFQGDRYVRSNISRIIYPLVGAMSKVFWAEN